MTQLAGRSRWIPVVTAAAVLAACDSGTDPLPEYDPLETLDRLDDVVDPLDASGTVFDGIWLATETLYAYGAAPVADLLRSSPTPTLRTAVPDASSLRRIATRQLERTTGLTEPGAGDTGTPMPRLAFPSTLTGRTLVWDPAQGYVVDPDLSGAPANGVRVVYYVTDASGIPTSSVTPLGYIDLTDADRSLAERVGVHVVEYGATVSQDRTVADYYVEMAAAGSNSAGSLEIESAGTITDGVATLDFDVTQRFTWSDSEDYDRLVLDYLFDAQRGPVTLVLEAESAFEAPDWATLDIDVNVGSGGADRVEVDVAIAADGTLSGGVYKGGERVIEVTGTDGDPQFRRPRGDTLTGTEINALEQVWTRISDIIALTEWLIYPWNLLILPG